ncbi:TIGR02265 family protein [Myxococcus stipitatus]|uniref:TIGR02265 family protein n=1 Tax=Myxococcus stipitatus TaxID=83455 RepID=UPI0030CC0D55
MAFAKNDLDQRLALVRPDDTVRGLIFNAVLLLAEKQLGPDMASRLREPIFKRSPVDFFSYPAVDAIRLLYSTSEALARAGRYGTQEEAVRACGAAAVTGFFSSTVGQTLTRLIGKGDPKRLLSNAPTAYSTLVSYGRRDYNVVTERHVRLSFHGDMQPVQFHEGVLQEALKAIQCKGSVVGTPHGYFAADYDIVWE